jgi:hypothetical protein
MRIHENISDLESFQKMRCRLFHSLTLTVGGRKKEISLGFCFRICVFLTYTFAVLRFVLNVERKMKKVMVNN